LDRKDELNRDHILPGWQSSAEATVLLPGKIHEPDLTELPISKAIFQLAGPAVMSMILLMIFTLVDAWWVGKLGAEAFAGVSAAAFIYWALQSVATLVTTGVTAMVARFVGAKQPNLASVVMAQGLVMAAGMALFFGITGLLLQKHTFVMMGLSGNVLKVTLSYMTWLLIGLAPIYIFFAIDASFRGMGDTKTPLKIIALALLLNAILDPLFIFGVGPLPRLEAGGAALATVVAHIFAALSGLHRLRKKPVKLVFNRQANVFNGNIIWRITRIGAPIAFSGVMFSASYMALTKVITDFGSQPLAALGLGHRIEGLCYFTSVGFAVAAETLVGQNLGAQKPTRAAKSAWIALIYISTFLAVVSLTFIFFAEQIIGFFMTDPFVIKEGATYLRIVALCEVFLGSEIVLEGAFGGAGNSVPPMVISVIFTWLRIPLSLFLANHLSLGSSGVWWAISLTTGIKGALMALWFRLGRWKSKKV
jgi:putative MATE family efflux protein